MAPVVLDTEDLLAVVARGLAAGDDQAQRRPVTAQSRPGSASAPRRRRAQRGWKGQPEGIFARFGGWPVIGWSRPPFTSTCGTDFINPSVYGCAGRVKTSSTVPRSTIRPAYMTATLSATSLTTPRSWVMSTRPIPVSRCRSLSSHEPCACTVTSRRWSARPAMRIFGSERGSPSRSSRAAACRRRTGAGSRSPVGRAGMRTAVHQLDGVLLCLFFDAPGAPGNLADLEAHADTGFSDDSASWKTWRSPARAPCAAPPRQGEQLRPSNQISPCGSAPGACSRMPMSPGPRPTCRPDSPRIARVSPCDTV